MNRRRALRFAPPVAVLVFSAAFLALTFQLPVAARSAPLMVAWVTLLLAVIDIGTRLDNPLGQFLMRMLNPAGLLEGERAPSARDVRHALHAMGLMAVLVVALLLLGVLLASALFIAGAYLLGGASRWLAVIVAVVFTSVLGLVFAVLLQLSLFPGLLFGGAF